MNYKILVIDDDEPMHILTKNLLGKEFELVHARNAQEGIDILSEESVNLILSDIHMPGISGLEFLESLMKDADKKNIPVLVMTNLPTIEKEKRALDLGAADFIEKTLFTENKEEIVERVRMKLVSSVDVPDLSEELSINKKKLVSRLMSEAISGDFISTAKKLCEEMKTVFNLGHISFWTISDGSPNLISSVGIQFPQNYGANELKKEHTFQQLLINKEPYLTNHIFNEELGTLIDFSRDNDFPAEIGIPMFSLDERNLLMNKMKIPKDAELFAYLILKRNKLFSTKEYEMASRLLTQTGTILWRLYKEI